MPLLDNPTLDQLRRIKAQNLGLVFLSQKVYGIGIGPRTSETGLAVELETTGANTIVVVVDPRDFSPAQVPGLLTGIDADGTEITVAPSIVPLGLFKAGASGGTASVNSGRTQARNLDDLLDEPVDPSSPTARLIVNDDRERDQLMSGLHIGIQFDGKQIPEGGSIGTACEAVVGSRVSSGTLCCIAETIDTERLVALTCHHVVIPPGSVVTTTKDAGGVEVGGTEVAGDFQLTKRDGDFVLRVSPPGASQFSDAVTRRTWMRQNGTRSDDFIVGHPTPGDCCEFERDEVGRFYRSRYTSEVDAAAILLDESQTENCIFPLGFLGTDLTDWRAEMLGVGGSDAGAGTTKIQGPVTTELTLAELQEPFTRPNGTPGHRLRYLVRKYGTTSGRTSGLVRCIEYEENPSLPPGITVPPESPGADCVPIKSLPVKDHIYIVPLNEQTGTLGEVFALGGDSGAAALNRDGQIVGIVTTGLSWQENRARFDSIDRGWGATITRISAVMEALQVTIKPFDAAQTIRTVPDGNGDFASASRALRSPLVVSARRLLPTVRRLVNRNRRVTVAWHRSSGPTLTWGLIRALRDRTLRVPADVSGRASTELLATLLDVLCSQSDEHTREQLEKLRPWLMQVPGKTLSELIEMLEGDACQQSP